MFGKFKSYIIIRGGSRDENGWLNTRMDAKRIRRTAYLNGMNRSFMS
jgi:hypothetical protein